MKLITHIEYHTVWGETLALRVRGKSYPMEYTPGDIWVARIGRLHPGQRLEYRYEVYQDGVCTRTEWFSHCVQLPSCNAPVSVPAVQSLEKAHHLIASGTVSDDVTDSVSAGQTHRPALHAILPEAVSRNATVPEILSGGGEILSVGKNVVEIRDVWSDVPAGLPLHSAPFAEGIFRDDGCISPEGGCLSSEGGCPVGKSFGIGKCGITDNLGSYGETGLNGNEEEAGSYGNGSPEAASVRRGVWKAAGTAIPVFSLRSENGFGVGEFNDLKLLVDWAAATGQKVIQLLPVNDTTMTWTWRDSYPYNACSSFALHPQFIHLPSAGVVEDDEYYRLQKELNSLPELDYERVNREKHRFLRMAFEKSGRKTLQTETFKSYVRENSEWLLPYAVYCVLRDRFGTADFTRWRTGANDCRFASCSDVESGSTACQSQDCGGSAFRSVADPMSATCQSQDCGGSAFRSVAEPMSATCQIPDGGGSVSCSSVGPGTAIRSSLDIGSGIFPGLDIGGDTASGTADCPAAASDYSVYDRETVMSFAAEHREDVEYWYFVQYHLHMQLLESRNYAHSKGVIFKGDLPIGVSRNSADAWMDRDLFNMDSCAGAPPDAFSTEGQNWGFPTYNWDVMEKDGFAWWKARLGNMSRYFDAFRIDHILGFFRIWEIPLAAKSGLAGHFSPALPYSSKELADLGFDMKCRQFPKVCLDRSPGALFVPDPHHRDKWHPCIAARSSAAYAALAPDCRHAFDSLYEDFFYHRHNRFWKESAMRKLPALLSATGMLACGEDLGMIPACVPEIMREYQILSLEIQRMPKKFGERFADPAEYPYYSVCTTSTHDTSTLRAWWEEDREMTRLFWKDMLGGEGEAPDVCTPSICRSIIQMHLDSPSMLAILPIQDWLSVDGTLRLSDPMEERINIPSDPHHYWRYRMHLTLESLLRQDGFNSVLREMILSSGR